MSVQRVTINSALQLYAVLMLLHALHEIRYDTIW